MNNAQINIVNKLRGRFRVQVLDGATGSVKEDTGWFDNLITNTGMDWIGSGGPTYNISYGVSCLGTHCAVGTGTSAPSYSDVNLTAQLAVTPTIVDGGTQPGTATYVAGPPTYWSGINTYNFGVGNVVGTISEVGVGNTDNSGTLPVNPLTLFNHALIVDGAGNPTTVSVTAADALVVSYELRNYLNLTDNTYSISISGNIYTGTYRFSRSTTAKNPFFGMGGSYNGNFGIYVFHINVYNGTISTVDSYPTGATDGGVNNSSTTFSSYVAGTYYRQVTCSIGTAHGNLTGGISAFEVVGNLGNWQFSSTPAIPKTADYTFSLTFNIGYARYTI